MRAALVPPLPSARRPAWLPEDPAAVLARRRLDLVTAVARERAELLDAARPGLALRAEKVAEVDADELQEVAVLARALGEDPAAAVDRTVRAALEELQEWDDDLHRLVYDLHLVHLHIGFDAATNARGRALDADLERVRAGLLAEVARYHHGGSGPRSSPRRWAAAV
ncbi:hypothetical protein [Streptomyces sp. NRRL S-495]|uniref:hypothetical protein n=1 Tax=Streptomyces sp. NRRL S-495 TaxID=1609133 RepID=UPI0005F99F1C|nr:hypothetical protein [Streptomyces sp. NRRL S-495]KJY27426.1 hypothetical protein VR45_34875 [Streptomyces sp. NRRL S-495]